MVDVLPEAEFGPQIGIREYSFLDNPLLDNKVHSDFKPDLSQTCSLSDTVGLNDLQLRYLKVDEFVVSITSLCCESKIRSN